MKKRFYIYPRSRSKKKSLILGGSPYVSQLGNALSTYFIFSNKDDRTKLGVTNLFKYIFSIDILVLNWLEDLPDKKGGKFQLFLFYMAIFFLQVKKTKIIWVLHNKISHDKRNFHIKNRIFSFLIRKSHLILTHSKEGIEFANQQAGKKVDKIVFFHHPLMKEVKLLPEKKVDFDIIIWGKILPYKGVDHFLQFLKEQNKSEKFRILLAGEIYPEEYYQKIMTLKSDTVTIVNRFIVDRELEEYISRSKMILFPYKSDSVLSSGALMDSIIYGKNVIGPHTGAFKDLQEEGVIFTYRSFQELITLIEKIQANEVSLDQLKIRQFLESNTWDNMIDKLKTWL